MTMLFDANAVLRFNLNDHEEMADKVEEILQKETVSLTIEVQAEIVYVLEKVYSVSREDIAEGLLSFIKNENIQLTVPDIAETALSVFRTKKLDFVDCVLFAYHSNLHYEVFTFDKKLQRLLKNDPI
ncbi:PIN domain-containing protein [Eubacterium sp. 1001713B170207_170306_E7]|uniref:PIN domain-containing protein n=1 Tax=Eubacterium sp. 1001713B170207_170306_E7 TaxID=2787097 RepID=UPI001A9AA258|nr:PIN domain-containing protein [Eubacterium sp. 1001713B170207_170306_E7]